ncbi:hypothetical protein ETH_00018580 [Eimeria tenella]|uniref:Transmembrane protein n=1 Tax=Eimeria tenella TaxID=5802 RepID=C8TDX1_EIMTE|nr:hypothetical protein ETH_00018580 [Eimeria tenella]CAK51457.1 hypothetical protein e2017b09.tmp0221 [Eimeria tenella]CDJ42457.1 hypothetical protein ETH_00018580 [Eimeria tenella]|eukprot:XP_013233207.1 hypothetical protein ETH_00018580 [Eimeria tenella]
MNPQAQFLHDQAFSGCKDQQTGTDSYSQQSRDFTPDDGHTLVQSLSKTKPFSASRPRLLLVAFTSVAAAYILLICFHFIKVGQLLAPQSRYLADRYDGSCDWGNAAEPSGNGDDRTTGGTQEQRAQELTNEGLLSPHDHIRGVHESVTSLQGVGVVASIGEETSGTDLGQWAQERQQFGVKEWANRNLPEPVKERLTGIFSRMVRASKLCRSLLPMLTLTQRLHVTYFVMRLMSLDLGALSLVREDMEPARQSVGDSLITLGLECLRGGGVDVQHENLRTSIRQLISLIEKVKLPRRVFTEYNAAKYRKKMMTMLPTSGLVLKNCLGVLEGLLQFNRGDSQKLPEAVVEQQFCVLKALYKVHAEHISNDDCTSKHILKCQEQTGTHALLDYQQVGTDKSHIPKLSDLQERIKEAVRGAGGLLPLQQPSAQRHHTNGRMFFGDSQLRETYVEALYGQWRHHMLQGSSAAAEQQALHFAALSVSENVYRGASLPSSAYPLRQPWQPLYQGHESFAQPVPQVTSSPWNQQSQSVSSPSLQASGGSAMPWMHTAHQRIQGAGPRLSLAPSLLARPHRLWAAQSTESVTSTTSLQRQRPAGGGVEGPLAPTAQLRQRARAEQRVRFEPPAAGSQSGVYSLFGQGGVPSWSPVSAASAASMDIRGSAGHDRASSQMQGLHHASGDSVNEGQSSREVGRFGENH